MTSRPGYSYRWKSKDRPDDNGIKTPQPPAHSFARGPATRLTTVGPRPNPSNVEECHDKYRQVRPFLRVPHTMNRIDVSTGVDFDEFRAALEDARATSRSRTSQGDRRKRGHLG